MGRLRAVALVALFLAQASSGTGRAADSVRDGDVVFQTSKSGQSLAVQRATGSRYSHMGMILYREGKPFVFEASATVRFTPLEAWINRGQDRHYVVKRLRDAETRLTATAVEAAKLAALRLEGKKYDLTFEWSDDRMYCSELVWKVYKQALGLELGELQKLREFNLQDPAVRTKLRERYGANVPLDERVISPAAMFAWPGLETVMER